MTASSSSSPVPPATPTGAAAAATTGTGASSAQMASASSFNTMEDLRKKDPKLYNAMMQGAAMTIINESKHNADRFKERWQEMLRDLEG